MEDAMFLKTGEGQIAYETNGTDKKRAIVFIHGFPFNRSMWNDQVRLLSRNHLAVTFDVRGHGESSEGTGLIDLYVDDLFALLDHLGLHAVTVCGLSMGGYIALRGIERDPSRFKGIVLCDTKSPADTNAAKLNRANQIRTILAGQKNQFADAQVKTLFAPESFEGRKAAVEKIRKIIESTSERGLVDALIALAARMDMTESLEKISAPTLIIVGDRDKVTPPAEAEAMRSRIHSARMVVVKGAGHLSNLENPEEFNSALETFLSDNSL